MKTTNVTLFSSIELACSIIAIALFLVFKWWMVFSYWVFMVGAYMCCLAFCQTTKIKNFLQEKTCYLNNSILLVLNAILAFYPFFFWSIGMYEGGIIVTVMIILTLLVQFLAIVECVRHYIQYDKLLEKYNFKREMEEKNALLLQTKINEDPHKFAQAEKEYGKLTNFITLGENFFDEKILVFADTKTIIIYGKIYKFGDILGCIINNEQTIVKGEVTATTTTDTGSMLGRAAVGGLLLGGTGAIIGGNSAKKETIINQTNDTITHHYTVSISLKDLSNPNVTIKTNNIDFANKIYSLITAVKANQ